ncbi:MAG: adenine phosphoribosyltransferase [Candidatus Magasanikbacteria bacterium RIFOXYD2_FULL_41_14]|uniref:Adenine phosphoribosyltransferase n=1 Tax=Candidatus Magasanikbacteria bacterium RIFOXYD2_FULL_41_14 TaxID=1798709 RepID=A0A1F6PFU7_9BACT|nr:MAG: adenine phosphoribosyltransferase [Candidatus Magasanikbacteria bacterium RIFOXYD2_FULL_41_14]
MFRDVTTLFKDAQGLAETARLFYEHYELWSIDKVAGIEARGFIIGAILAEKLGVGFVPIRKKGKLPAAVMGEEYDLEYGKDKIEAHLDAFEAGERVLLIDDLIATGGTALAACNLIEKLGAKIVGCGFVVSLPDLGGVKKILDRGYEVFDLIKFNGE